ncbi:MAG: hypothetical protein K5753_01320 [Clostridia bacterium]|nr:hypothetical protein [Clostridia bacterium]
MKKCKLLLAITVFVLLILTFVGCKKSSGPSIGVPDDLSVSNEVLTWSSVQGAIGYEVKVDDEIFPSDEESFELTIFDYEDHEISVRAVTTEGRGAFSPILTYARTQSSELLPQLSAPYGISMTANRLLWNSVLNNNGYKIYYDGKSVTAPKNSTYFDLTFRSDGTYYIQMQTLGDGVTYASSKVSATYAVTVKDGKAPLKKLSPVELSFDPSDKTIVWTNRYSASAVSYEIYKDAGALPVATIPADDGKTKMSFAPELNGNKTNYRMRLISNNGLYAPSDFSADMSFPIADAAPDGLSIAPNESKTAFELSWNARDLKSAYVVEVDGTTFVRTVYETYAIPVSTAVGEHKIRVRTDGDDVYYAASSYSGELVFYVEKTGVVYTPLSAPEAFDASFDEGTLSVKYEAVENAGSYRITISRGDQAVEYDVSGVEFTLSETQMLGEDLNESGKTKAASALALIEEGAAVSVRALSSNALFESSASTNEIFVCSDPQIVAVHSVDGLAFGASGLTWTALPNAEGYGLILDGEKIEVTQNFYSDAIPAGVHSARVYAKYQEGISFLSKELVFRTPKRADAPTALKITSGILTFVPAANASFYDLYANGAVVTSLDARETSVMLSNYIKTDGVYTLALKSKTYSEFLVESALSEEAVYVKTDGDYGTALKPYAPSSAAELASLLAEHPDAYFRLSADVYDFTGVRVDALSLLVFAGKIDGNGATLKNLRLSAPLFNVIRGAKLENMAIEIIANAVSFEQNGLLAKEIRGAEFENVSFKIAGSGRTASSGAFGVLAYQATDLAVTGGEIAFSDFSVSGDIVRFACAAYSANAVFDGVKFSGVLSASANVVSLSTVASQGKTQLNDCELTLGVSIVAEEEAYLAGGSYDGEVEAKDTVFDSSFVVEGDSVSYVGISVGGAKLEDCSIGGGLNATATSAEVFGLSRNGDFAANGVSLTSQFEVSAPARVILAGVTERLKNENAWKDSECAASLTVASKDATVGGVTIYDEVGLSGSFNVMISVDGGRTGNARVGGVSTYGAGGEVRLFGSIELSSVDYAEVGGVSLTADGKTDVSGSLTVRASECGEVLIGGVLCKNDVTIDAHDYVFTLDLDARKASVGALACEAGTANVSISGVRLEGAVKAEEVIFGGAFASVGSLAKTGNSSLALRASVEGEGVAAAFAADMPRASVSDLALSGTLSVKGCETYGVAPSVMALRDVSSSLSLSVRDSTKVVGFTGSADSVSGISYHDATISVSSLDALVVGGVENIASGTATGILRSVEFVFTPFSEEDAGSIEFFGLVDTVRDIENVSVESCRVTVGKLSHFVCGGLARSVSERIGNVSISGSISSEASENEIGAATYTLGGEAKNLSVGSKSAPFECILQGRGYFGGVTYESKTLAIEDSAIFVRANVSTAEYSDSEIGGIAASVLYGEKLLMNNSPNELSLTATGDGNLIAGGASAKNEGSIEGVRSVIDLRGAASVNATVGGISGEHSGDICLSRADGSIVANGKIGGIVGTTENATISESSSHLSIDCTDGTAGGFFAEGEGSSVRRSYSTVSFVHIGAGLFYSATNVIVETVYFAGVANEYSIARTLVNCRAFSFVIDASLGDLPAVDAGYLDHTIANLSYGYVGDDFNTDLEVENDRYPYIKALGAVVAPQRQIERLSKIDLTATVDLYSILPKFVSGIAPSVAWVDGGDALSITNGTAEVIDNADGVLYGYLSGGVKAFEVPYSASGFGAFEGEGTPESPYLIKESRYYKNMKSVLDANPTAHFKWDAGSGEISSFAFPALFTSSAPFRGTIDFDGATFVAPEIPENGIFGFIDGGTVKNLNLVGGDAWSGPILGKVVYNATVENVSIKGSGSGEVSIAESAEDSAFTDLTIEISLSDEASFAAFKTVSGGTLSNVSLLVKVYSRSSVSAYLAGRADGVTASNVQFRLNGENQGDARYALVNEAISSSFSKVLSVLSVEKNSADSLTAAGFALSSDGCSLSDAALILAVEGYTVPALAAAGTATYTNVMVLDDAAFSVTIPEVSGVTKYGVGAFRAAVSSIEGFVSGLMYAPVDYSLFLSKDSDFSVLSAEDNTALTALELDDVVSIDLDDSVLITSDDAIAKIVRFDYEGSNASVSGRNLIFTAAGEGTLVITNLYDQVVRVDISLATFGGFDSGSGTRSDPYVVASFADLKKLGRNAGAHYVLDQDLEGTISEPFSLNGYLSGSGSVTVTLQGTNLFDVLIGEISDVSFVLNVGEITAHGNYGLFASSASSFDLINSEITFNAVNVTLDDESTFGLLFGQTFEDASIQNVRINAPSVTMSASADATIGIVAAKSTGTNLDCISIFSTVTISSSRKVVFGAIGSINSLSEGEFCQFFTVNLDLTATASDLTVGAIAAISSADIKNSTVDATMVLNAAELIAGGAVGTNYGEIDEVSVSGGGITAEGDHVVVGGIIGVSYGKLSRSDSSALVSASSRGIAYAGGAVGEANGLIETTFVSSDSVYAFSSADESVLEETIFGTQDFDLLCASGGIVGVSFGIVSRVRASVQTVSAECAIDSNRLYVAFGGVAGMGTEIYDAEVSGNCSIESSEPQFIVGGLAGILTEKAERAVIGAVKLKGNLIGGAVGAFSFTESSHIVDVYSLATVSSEQAGLVGKIFRTGEEGDADTGVIRDCYYLNGVDVFVRENLDNVGVNAKLAAVSDFYESAIYDGFDSEIWNIQNGSLPSVKEE